MEHAAIQDQHQLDFRPALVAPTFNNAQTLAHVLSDADSLGLPIIVVNDGSTDPTADILGDWLKREADFPRRVAQFEHNRGKAAALQEGFAVARRLGYTHALTLDTDGQHAIEDAATLLRQARAEPAALIIGHRPIAAHDYPPLSRLGRRFSNLLVRLESGLIVGDSQSGLRVYPLAPLERLRAGANRYGFETEILTRAAWAGVPVRETPIRCIYQTDGRRVSHFHPVKDSLRALRMHALLLTLALKPAWPTSLEATTGTIVQRAIRWMNPTKMWRDIRAGRGDGRFPGSVAVGMFMAVAPLYGIKTVVCLIMAKALRLQPLVVLAVSSLNTPPTGPFLAAASIGTGFWCLHRRLPAMGEFNPFRDGWAATFRAVALEWVIGSILVGSVLAALAYVLAKFSLRWAKPSQSPG
ncbi:MAG: DUF2062 domain-containing protein [Tepidisphaeraceae bacterium]